jgi:hypothetical protein
MEKDDLLRDDFLGKLFQNSPTESPSDTFTDDVMRKIRLAPAMVPAQKPFFLFLKNSWSYILVSLALLIFLLTSDLPLLNIIPGKEYFNTSVVPYITSLFSMVKSYFGGMKNISVPLMIIAAGGFLLLMDHWIFRKPKIQASIFI